MLEEFEASVEAQFTTSEVGGDVPEAARAQFAALMEGMVAGMREMVANAAFMPEVPLVRDLRTTWEGTIWVQRWGSDPLGQLEFAGAGSGRDETPDGWIDVLAAEGGYVGTFSLEETPMPAAFRPRWHGRVRGDGRIRRPHDHRETAAGGCPLAGRRLERRTRWTTQPTRVAPAMPDPPSRTKRPASTSGRTSSASRRGTTSSAARSGTRRCVRTARTCSTRRTGRRS